MGTLVKIVPYNADWPRLYRETQDRLEALLGEITEGIEHVGSTPPSPILISTLF